MKRHQPIGKVLFGSPQTWAALGLIVLLELAFIFWFQPPFLMTVLIIGIGIVLFAAWPIMFLRSAAFRDLYSQLPYKEERQELETLLESCTEPFRKSAHECLALLDITREEFKSHAFASELDRIFQNLVELSRYHAQLYARTQQFGTTEQKSTMQQLLKQQVLSVENSLTALKAFSGNLTLLETRPEEYAKMGSELKAINQELLNVIQEV